MSEGGSRPWRAPRAGACVTVRVPASSANLGPGFDSVGLALGLWDEATLTVSDRPGVVVEAHGQGVEDIPLDERHLVYRSVAATLAHLDLPIPDGLHLVCANAVPHSRGLGSSATAIVTGALAAAALAHPELTADGERPDVTAAVLDVVNQVSAALEGHPDNSSASTYGGATVSVMERLAGEAHPITRTVRLRLHEEIDVVACAPATRLSTAHARSVLPQAVPLSSAVASTARGALLVHALTQDPAQLLAGTVDVLHQEQRRPSYPDSMALVDALRAAGHAAVVSGAGPSVLVLTTRDRRADVVALARERAAGWDVLTPGVPEIGAQVITVVH